MFRTILFISNMRDEPWGGSEELWVRTALKLAKEGFRVAASVRGWPQLDRRIVELSRAGVDVRPRPIKSSTITRVRRRLSGKDRLIFEIERSFGDISPDLVLISNADVIPPFDIAEMCIAKDWPFAIVNHIHALDWWPSGELAARLRKALAMAERCFFLSERNQILVEKQLGYDFKNADIVRNPLCVDVDKPIPWALDSSTKDLRMACVARLSAEKGQDMLLECLASRAWVERNWRLTFYGVGSTQDILERLTKRLKLQNRVSFGGWVPVKKIWHENDILVMASRKEGCPLTVVEAMWCGRPVVATTVGCNPDLIEDGVTGFLAPPITECISEALERMWMRREKLEEMGTLSAARIRKFLPEDPVGIFADKLKNLGNGSQTGSEGLINA